jgi:hypothetical protein
MVIFGEHVCNFLFFQVLEGGRLSRSPSGLFPILRIAVVSGLFLREGSEFAAIMFDQVPQA